MRLRDVTPANPTAYVTGHTDLVVAFNPDNGLLATASIDQTGPAVVQHLYLVASWMPSGCALVRRNLSMDARKQLLPDVPCERTCPDLPPGRDAPPDAPAARCSN